MELDVRVRDKLMSLYFSPDFPSLPGISNFPDDPAQQEQAAIEPLLGELPDPCNLQACSDLIRKLHERARNGWLPYEINRGLARATAAASRALQREPLALKDSDLEFDKQVEQAKADARKNGSATITIRRTENRRLHFDAWAKAIHEYDTTGREFPLLAAIRSALLRFSCLRSALGR